MNESRFLMTPEAALRLTERLARVKSVSQLDQPGEPQAATLAHSLTDLEKSFREVLETQLPRLLGISGAGSAERRVARYWRGTRHVLYHIRDPKFFDYLIDHDAGEA